MLWSLLYALGYSVIGILLLWLGYLLFDLITPAKIGQRIYQDKCWNAATVMSAVWLGLGAVEFTSIMVNGDSSFGMAMLSTLLFGVLGAVLQMVAFMLIDVVTPGKLREIVTEDHYHPGSLVAAAAMLAVSAIVCASMVG